MLIYSLKFWQRNEQLEKELHETEKTVIARDKLISELRLRMPATADRDEIILRATSKVNAAMSQKPEEKDYQTEHSIKIAQSTISSLQVTFLSLIVNLFSKIISSLQLIWFWSFPFSSVISRLEVMYEV